MKRLNRREILERMAAVTGGAVSLAVLGACDADVSVPENTDELELKALNKAQFDLVGDIADTIIPDTDTPGAKAVNVHFLIDELAANWMTAEEREGFLADLTALDERIRQEHGKSFSELSENERGQMLDQLGAEMLAAEGAGEYETGLSNVGVGGANRKHVYKELRELTIYGYYTSEVGASEELIYDPIPGEFKGCIPFSDVGKAWSVG